MSKAKFKEKQKKLHLHGTYPKKIGSVTANAALPARMPGLSLA